MLVRQTHLPPAMESRLTPGLTELIIAACGVEHPQHVIYWACIIDFPQLLTVN